MKFRERLDSGTNMQPLVGATKQRGDGRAADAEFLRDLLVLITFGQQIEHVAFALRQLHGILFRNLRLVK